MSNLKLAPHLSVPSNIAARTIFVAGTKGSGKTHNAGVLAEEMLDAGTHVVILDPLGVWFGLRHDREGGAGGFPIVILGGEHGDAPLEPTSGEVVADYIVRSGQSVILDMSGFAANAEQDRFVAALLLKLFRLKATEKTNLHLIMDEADMFVPQEQSRGQETLIGAAKTIVTKGRSRGLSMTMITQRPQSIAKAAIEEADVVLCHRMTGKRAVDAMKAWTDLFGSKEEAAKFYGTLPTLDDGECWVWSPQFLKAFERHKFRAKRTFDSSRTPEPGERRKAPKSAAAVDLAKLSAEIKASIEKKKADDPKTLKARIAELEKQLAAKPAAAPAKVETKIVEKLVVKDVQIRRLESLADGVALLVNRVGEVVGKFTEKRDELLNAAGAVRNLAAVGKSPPPAQAKPVAAPRVAPPIPKTAPNYSKEHRQAAKSADGLSKAQQRIIDALAWYESLGNRNPTLTQIGAVALIDPTGGYFSNTVGPLVTGGLITRNNGTMALTEAGQAVANPLDDVGTLAEYHEVLKRRILKMKSANGKSIAILEAVIDAGGESLTVEQIGELVGIDHTGGYFSNSIGPLSTAGVIERGGGVVRPTVVLFPEGLS